RAVLGDVVKIRQVLRALIDNAIKFTTSGTVSVRVKRTTQGQLHTIRYEVEDTGFGIEKAHLLQVFQRFHRLRPEIPGAGLGLSICRDLVNLMGGQIGIASVEGQGTLVYF